VPRSGSRAFSGPNAIAASIAMTCALAVCFLAAGCGLSPLNKHATAFSSAAGLVVDNSEDAYRAAIALRNKEQAAAAVYNYDKNPTWSPYKDTKPLLTPDQLAARIEVLDGLKAYAATLVDLTSTKPSDETEDAAAAAGANLLSLNQSVATALATEVPNAPVMSASNANAASTAILALAEYLKARKVKGSLPKVTQDMNTSVQTLCELLNSDINVLRHQADVDYQTLVTDLDLSIRHEGTTVTPYEHRLEVATLIELANQQKANDELLAKLQAALHTLELTHQALAAAAQGNNPESISQKIAELQAAGKDLNAYYKSLSATQ